MAKEILIDELKRVLGALQLISRTLPGLRVQNIANLKKIKLLRRLIRLYPDGPELLRQVDREHPTKPKTTRRKKK